MEFRQVASSLAVLFFTAVSALGQVNLSGGTGLPNVQSAWGLQQGYLIVNSNSRVFGQSTSPAGRSPFTVWDVTGRLNVSYGLSEHFEISANPIVYQDVNKASYSFSAPHDIFLSMKAGSFVSPGRSVAYGVSVATRIPVGDTHNIPFERYATDRVGWGLTGLLSYSKDPLYHDQATSLYVNIGYWNHNDAGALSSTASGMSQELLYGLAVQMPKGKMSFSFELHGNAFLHEPPAVAYSRESYLYFTPGASYRPIKWLSVNLGLDLRLIDSADKTSYSSINNNVGVDRTMSDSQPNYPGWRFNFGTTFNLLPTSSYRMSERDVLMRRADSRRELFEEIVREQRETESAEAELERIRAERIRAEKELERLRRILEGETPQANEEKEEKEEEK